MKCVMCGRTILKASLAAGDATFGPKCARKLAGPKPKRRKAEPAHQAIDHFTMPLFPELEGCA